ncbi:MAG: cell division protein FtsK [Waddliaceae bacterium]|nr:cell division protein FtsK [Waddliaceae bacterium]
MSKKQRKKRKKKLEQNSEKPISPFLEGLAYCMIAALTWFCISTFHHGESELNILGLAGYSWAYIHIFLFGLTAYIPLLFLAWVGWKKVLGQPPEGFKRKASYIALLTFSLSVLFNVYADSFSAYAAGLSHKVLSQYHFSADRELTIYLGGKPSYYLYEQIPSYNFLRVFNRVGTALIFSSLTFFSLAALFEWKILAFLQNQVAAYKERRKERDERKLALNREQAEDVETWELERSAPRPNLETTPKREIRLIEASETDEVEEPSSPPSQAQAQKANIKPPPRKTQESEAIEKRQAALMAQAVHNGDFENYQLPPLSSLTSAKKIEQSSLKRVLQHQATVLEETLESFGIDAKVDQINCGPTIASFEVLPSVGVKVQKIKALESDIALNLRAKSIRIIAPIPGKAAVGVEIPSPCPQEVSFKEMLASYQKSGKRLMIPIILGKAVNGELVISDLSKMPHLIIAGATGSGKSVCINTIVMSIVMNAKPDEIKLLMVDPKKVELTPYSKLPHMIAPVITEPPGACTALNWLVKEMERRYELLKQLGLRNIAAFNKRTVNKETEETLDIDVPEKMFYIVGIIDELADLMMVSASDIEGPIARIAQMARAVGIHLILATQRPSREVITGIIKANFPTRIAFKVASRVNSQIIIDENGAESLLGNGDMLFLPPGTSNLTRAQGAYIRDEDINEVLKHICSQSPTHYLISSFDQMEDDVLGMGKQGGGEQLDSLYDQAYTTVVEAQNASTTFLQRKLKIGYARAASIMDQLEQEGVIGPAEGSKGRKVLHSSRYAEENN